MLGDVEMRSLFGGLEGAIAVLGFGGNAIAFGGCGGAIAVLGFGGCDRV